ncbi:beta-cubebene synthase-like isoform X2 [Magnolia sinica]|uniref:beta-cubebene synthase-like isoform X2 n=1 Tax=Magnolia sinica TaxID=86752 RepID=UPI00265A38E4|nr:beta-cubebene synthase-like isoform X2 [Magnolia sinica]
MSLILGSGHSDVPTTQGKNGKKEIGRASANYHPSVSGDRFIAASLDEKELDPYTKQRAEKLKEEVKKILSDVNNSVQKLNLIDAIQCLGVAYHFETDIEKELQRIYDDYNDNGDNLHAVALRFRLLTQRGYNVSSHVFRKFKDNDGKFKATLSSDIRGLLSLYEAAYLRIHGDDILDEAITFTTMHLKSAMPHLTSPLAQLVELALEVPLGKHVEKLQPRYYISIYEKDKERSDVLLEFAKLDFNILQSLHERKLRDISSHLQVKGKEEIVRRSAKYKPSVWGDHFIASSPQVPDARINERIEELKKEVKRMLRTDSGPFQKMSLIDEIQRLGVAYHFEMEIEEAMRQIYDAHINGDYDGGDDLHAVALQFRLLRQHGYNIPPDVFEKFKEDECHFKASLCTNVKGLLSLYEAAYLSTRGERILDEAIAFTSKNLRAMVAHLESPLSTQVAHALELPLRKGMPCLEARRYISLYQELECRTDVLLELAKLDFNLLQSLHQGEIGELSRWWRAVDFASKLPFVRDRLVECYFWILGVYFEPQYSFGRIAVTKLISIASVMDDIYDVYGTLEELKPFTEAIQRWDIGTMDQLPEYMQVCFHALYNVVKEIEEKTTDEGRSYTAHYSKEAMKALTRAYLMEAHWFSTGHVPTLDEYLEIAVMSSGYPMLAVQALVGLGDVATKEAFDWVLSVPKIVWSTGLIARVVDDLQTNKVEQSRGDNASSVQCYMKEHGVTDEEACQALQKLVTDAWKDINKACLRPTPFPGPILAPSLNLARMMEVLYQNGDEYTDSAGQTKERIASLLVDPIPI